VIVPRIEQRMPSQFICTDLFAPIAKPFDFRFGLLSRIAKPFLHFAHEFTALSVNHIKVVIRQLSSLLLNFVS
jgi:hypothetical protein